MVMGKELRQTTCPRGRKEGYNPGSNLWVTLNIHPINNHKGALVTLAQRRPISIIDIATIKEISKLSPLGRRSLILPTPSIFWQTLKTRSILISSINSFCNQVKTKWGKESETKSLLGLVHFYQSAISISTKTISKQLSVPKTSFIKARLVDLLTQLATIRTIPRKWEVSEGETRGKVRPYPLKTSINSTSIGLTILWTYQWLRTIIKSTPINLKGFQDPSLSDKIYKTLKRKSPRS